MKNIYRFLTFCCLLSLLFVSRGHAQTNFRPGYVLPLTGDTLRGEVDLRDNRVSAQRCRFRANAEATVTTYTPAELRGYGLKADHKQYRAFSVSSAPTAPQLYFLEILVDGPAALYFLRDAQQNESFYVVSPNTALTQLERTTARVVRNGQIYSEQNNLYRTTLVAALAGCPQAQSQLPNLLFQESSLRKVVAQYNSCQGYQALSSGLPPVAASRAAFGFMGGVAQQSLTYNGYPYELTTAVGRNTGYIIGPFVRFNAGRLSQKVSVVLAILYEPEKFELEKANMYYGASTGVVTRSKFDLTYLRLPIIFRYTYPRGKVSPLAELGLTIAYALKTDNTTEQATSGGYFMKPQPLLASNAFRSFQLGLGGGLGLSTRMVNGRSVALLARAEVSNGFSGASAIGTYVVHLYGLLSIDLTK